jgi:hypothetical protein
MQQCDKALHCRQPGGRWAPLSSPPARPSSPHRVTKDRAGWAGRGSMPPNGALHTAPHCPMTPNGGGSPSGFGHSAAAAALRPIWESSPRPGAGDSPPAPPGQPAAGGGAVGEHQVQRWAASPHRPQARPSLPAEGPGRPAGKLSTVQHCTVGSAMADCTRLFPPGLSRDQCVLFPGLSLARLHIALICQVKTCYC